MFGTLNPCGGGDPIPLLRDRLLVGRRSRCDLTLNFSNISSHHCQLEYVNGYWRVRDLGSRNGIKVNGERCDQEWLMPGDILHIAKHRFEIEYQPTADAPPLGDDDPFELSLMQKAGLEPRPAAPPPPPPTPLRRKAIEDAGEPQTEEDLAVKWLQDDD